MVFMPQLGFILMQGRQMISDPSLFCQDKLIYLKKKHWTNVNFNFRKAYDFVYHSIVLDKLVRDELVKWILESKIGSGWKGP